MPQDPISELGLERFLELSADPVVLVDREGRIVAINHLGEALFGFPPDELCGKGLGILLPERFRGAHEQHLRDYFREPRTRPMGSGKELVLRRKDGSELPVEISLHPIEENGSTFVVGSVRDVTLRRRSAELLMKRNVALEQEIVARKAAEVDLKDLGQRMITAQEDDRARIARDLHDDISQRIHGASIGVELALRILGTDPDGAAERLQGLQAQLDEIAESARGISHELHPAALELLGFVAALEGLCEDFESNHGVAMQVLAPKSVESELSAPATLCLYRIAQEALRNTAKHADASEVVLELSMQSSHMLLRIRDNGAGFDPAAKRAGLGLASMRERARLLNGTVTLNSEPGAGTEVLVDIPV